MDTENSAIGFRFEGNMKLHRQMVNKILRRNHAADSYKTLDLIESIPVTKPNKNKKK